MIADPVGDTTRYRYYFHKAYETYEEAKALCQADGHELFMPKTRDMYNEAVKAVLQGVIEHEVSEHVNYVWLDLTDLAEEGAYVWGDQEPVGWAIWDKGQPENLNDVGIDCVSIFTYEEYVNPWRVSRCSMLGSYLCQKGKFVKYNAVFVTSSCGVSAV